MGQLDSKVAIVTGGTGGLGEVVVSTLLAAGAAVVVPHRRAGDLAELRARLGQPEGAPLGGMVLDLTDEAAVQQAYAEAAVQHGGIDILVNIAGGFGGGKPVHETPWSLWQTQLDLNLKTTVLSCQAAVPHLLGTGGNIVNLASNAGLMGQAYTVAYCMSKGAVIQLTRSLAMEFVRTDLRVNAIAPAAVNTPLLHNFEIADGVDVELMKPYMGFRGMAEADELAGLFAFVASDEVPNMHGAVISVDNGITAG